MQISGSFDFVSIFLKKTDYTYRVYFVEKVPNFEIVWPTPATPRALTVKGVYVVSHSYYVHQYEPVCNQQSEFGFSPECSNELT